jgi:glutamate---cysteine ligase / carboxylate-amine ligase
MTEYELGLFEAFGIEMEYMLVDAQTLDVRPVADQILQKLEGKITSDAEIGPITWSNELALHVLELKCTRPTSRLRPLPNVFESAIRDMRPLLEDRGLCLLPTAVHPWMNPAAEAKLWPHEYHEVYETYDRIFNCRTHGWANVQSVHLNLPFRNDEEFGRLHAAVRLVLPLLPALAASSPILEGVYTGQLDTRMQLYAGHCAALPTLTGELIPEPIYSQLEYQRKILEPIAADVAPLDTVGVMQLDFLNARGAIARFDRGSIEIRVMDVQEYPGADVAICAAVISLLKALCSCRWSSLESQQAMPTANLRKILDETCRLGETAVIADRGFLEHFGIAKSSIGAGQLWQKLMEVLRPDDRVLNNLSAPLEIILENGTLASRIKAALGKDFTRSALVDVYREIADCLVRWQPFLP